VFAQPGIFQASAGRPPTPGGSSSRVTPTTTGSAAESKPPAQSQNCPSRGCSPQGEEVRACGQARPKLAEAGSRSPLRTPMKPIRLDAKLGLSHAGRKWSDTGNARPERRGTRNRGGQSALKGALAHNPISTVCVPYMAGLGIKTYEVPLPRASRRPEI